MNDRHTPILRSLSIAAGAIALLLFIARDASADVVGRLHFSVKNAADEKPLANAKIVLKDSAKVRPDVTLTTDAKGSVTSPPLDARPWQSVTNSEKPADYTPDTRNVTVVTDTTTEVEVLLEPKKEVKGAEEVIKITAAKDLVNQGDTSSGSNISSDTIKEFPAAVQNPFQYQGLLLTNPGMVQDSVGQVHPRGEHSSTTLFIDGFELPDVLMGRAGALLVPDSFQNLDIMTGGYAPEYGGETAAIMNITLKSGPIKPFVSYDLQGGSWNTFNGALSLGGQGGRPLGKPDDNGDVARAFGYFVDISGRTTDNALQSPQPDDQTAHNLGQSEDYFGHFTYKAGSKDELSLTLNSAPAFTDVANRAGLSNLYAPYGQGYGFGGERDLNGNIAPGIAAMNPGSLGTGNEILASQNALGQDDYQRDVNDLGLLNWRHTLSTQLTSLVSVSMVHSGQSILNGNSALAQSSASALANGTLPVDSSIEYLPNIVRNYHHEQAQGSLTYNSSQHTVKGGILYDNEEGDESYTLIPGSQLALDAIATLNPTLAPSGSFAKNGATDVNGYGVYTANPGATSPTLNVHRTGFYAASYIQDTWKVTKKFTANYGLRLDWYQGNQNVPGQTGVNQANVSPRVNLAYEVAPKTIMRAAYNRLFIQPPLAQGEIIGQAIIPETLSQYDFSVERQLTKYQKAKIAYYAKNMRNQIDTGLLIPNTQIGAYTSVNFTEGGVHGVEVSWDLTPKNNVGLGSYVSYTNSIAKPGGLVDGQPGTSAPTYNDHDQLNTISTGVSYTWKKGQNTSLDFYFGSGLGSSGLSASNPLNGNNTAPRSSNEHTNLTFSTGPGLFGGGPKNGKGGVSLIFYNIFNDTSVINFNSGFSGTRFDQGRTVMLDVFGRF